MIIEKLMVNDYRNYAQVSVDFSPYVNLFLGNNGMGKTNLLEALYICSTGKSGRTSKDKELIRFLKERANIRVIVKKSYGTDRIDIVLDKNQNKAIALNGLPLTRIGELMGALQTVYFSPDEMKIVKESPQERRRFADIALSQISRSYFYLICKYSRIISQRNRLLKSGNGNNDSLFAWDIQLAQLGAQIIKTRRGFVTALSQQASIEHAYLTDNTEKLTLTFESIDGDTIPQIEQNILQALNESRQKDLKFGFTHQGPHRDDIGIFVNDTDARKFGSQGQQRTASLAIKLAQVELTCQKGEAPILLLDDVMGELDLSRRHKLIERIKGMQTIITATHLEPEIHKALSAHKIFNIKNGTITHNTCL